MPDWTDLHAHIHRLLKARQLLPQGSHCLVAVSGGQDSMALLKLLWDLRPKWGWRVVVAHANHRWRADAEANASFVETWCRDHGISCDTVTAAQPPSSEAAARQWRYDQFHQLARYHGCTRVATGHTATDRAETLLYNLMRGSGADGLQALTWQRPLQPAAPLPIVLVRPLLAITRAETVAFCRQQGLPHWQDCTNQDRAYARNRIRLDLLPYLAEQFNPRVEHTLAQTAEVLAAEVAYLETMVDSLYASVVEADAGGRPRRLHRPPLQVSHVALQRRLIRRVLQQRQIAQVGFEQVAKVVHLITAPHRSQSDPLPGGAIARVDGDWIRFIDPDCA
ncbi:tRNA(Ile)-lysidine synthase [Halomicronema hongdechloris C2206]|uniref:tRNA(Ile)-lysidine synthase n=1 Tax=Halomicronema hongdechloris C2206 TaxID=1641165 RepID=A0A1Z3HPT5_9CYAN|nr:tRNA lysidine(34) synthetase TilS [Halomicronema hongdechloris]ASC72305.1 tRNA(Ile)-lysidine synthase [Halomicronema hongdechloris C2206]